MKCNWNLLLALSSYVETLHALTIDSWWKQMREWKTKIGRK